MDYAEALENAMQDAADMGITEPDEFQLADLMQQYM